MLLTARPPWFDTKMPSAPCSMASSAPSAVMMPFRDHLHVAGVLEALHVVPGVGIARALGAPEPGPHRPHVVGVVLVAALAEHRRVALARKGAPLQLAVAAAEEVDGPNQDAAAGAGHAVDDPLVHVPVGHGVDLEPVRLAAGLGDVRVGLRALVRLHLQNVPRPRGPGRAALALACDRPRGSRPDTGRGARATGGRRARSTCRARPSARRRAAGGGSSGAGTPRGSPAASRSRRPPCAGSPSAGPSWWHAPLARGPRR